MKEVRSLYETQQLDISDINNIFKIADDIRSNLSEHSSDLSGKVLASLFYEPSTRTRLSFESAMLKLGGEVIGTENAKEFSSAVKGETMVDTVRVVEKYADYIVIRHGEEGVCKEASSLCSVPIINAGEGKGQHPTQALLDLYTIYKEIGRLDNIKIAAVGDLASGRTIRSLCYLLCKFKNVEIVFVSPDNLKMKEDVKEYLRDKGTKFSESEDLNSIIGGCDIIYMTRIQKERISEEDYDKARGKFVINMENLSAINPNSRILHPLPHVEEIDLPLEIERSDKRVAYFRQVENGLYVRMALLRYLLKEKV